MFLTIMIYLDMLQARNTMQNRREVPREVESESANLQFHNGCFATNSLEIIHDHHDSLSKQKRDVKIIQFMYIICVSFLLTSRCFIHVCYVAQNGLLMK